MGTVWKRGDTIIVRYGLYERMTQAYRAFRDDPVNVAGWPYIVLDDTPTETVLYIPEGTPLWRWDVEARRFREPRITHGDSVRLLFASKPYDVSLYYDTGSGPAPWVSYYFPGEPGPFFGWKVDIVSPYIRKPWGFDVIDEVLDIAVRPDRTHRLLDGDMLTRLVEMNVYTPEDAIAVRAAATGVIALIDRAAPPFDDRWRSWRPAPDLVMGSPPSGWETAAPD